MKPVSAIIASLHGTSATARNSAAIEAPPVTSDWMMKAVEGGISIPVRALATLPAAAKPGS